MGKILVLAEKPSVGREIARVLNCKKSANGFISSDRYIVTWALGHLVTLADPEHYDDKFKVWNIEYLPMLPSKTDLVVIKETSKQFTVVRDLLKSAEVESIVIATDAGREGELVARFIIQKAGVKKPIKRLWISSQTDKAIKDGFANLKSGELYMNLYFCALARAKADWLVGLNVTRALTTKFNAQLSAGRVQTPTLALIVDREEQIRKFVPQQYFNIRIKLDGFYMLYHDKKNQTRIFDKNIAEQVKNSLKGNETKIIKSQKTEKRESIPMLYDLTELQRDANKRYNFSAKQTLQIMQSLYERHKILTYPRTDSRYLTSDIVPTLKDRIKAVSIGNYVKTASQIIKDGKTIDRHCIDNSKVSDHHAIIPTEQSVVLSTLSHEERCIYDLVVRRFLAVFLGDCIKEQLSVEAVCNGHNFGAIGTHITFMGFREAYAALSEDNDEEDGDDDDKSQTLPSISVGQSFVCRDAILAEKKTKPPARYNEATLLSAMEKPGKYIDDKDLRKVIEKTTGLGTPATRADIIEKLFSSFYVEKRGKEIFPTNKAIWLINNVPKDLKEPLLTAKWEQKLESIKEGKLSETIFTDEIKAYTTKLVDEIKISGANYIHDNLTKTRCPNCDKFMLEVSTKKGKMLVCQDRDCGYRQNLSIVSNSRCPECNKMLEIVGDGEKRKFICKCGYRETMESFNKRMADRKSIMSKKELENYMKNQNKTESNDESPLAIALKKAMENNKK